MLSDRRRILELALESLENRRKRIDEEIAEISRELLGKTSIVAAPSRNLRGAGLRVPVRKRSRFSKEERLRRSERMKAYWENWRKKRARQK